MFPSSFFASRLIGDYQITALSDGDMDANLTLLSGIDTAKASDIQRHAGIAEHGNIHINCYLIRGRGRTILVDSGLGESNHAGGWLKKNLHAVGVRPEDVDTVLLTHGHPDHISGLLDAEGHRVYTHAQLYLHPLEIEYWQDNDQLQQASERVQRNFALVRRTLAAYEQNLNILKDDEVVEGIRPVWLPGHTPGHTGFRIDAADKSLLIWGDIVHFPHIQSAQPDVGIAFDYNSTQAQSTRKSILEQAVREKLLIAGMHLGQQGFAHIIPAGQGYRIVYVESENE